MDDDTLMRLSANGDTAAFDCLVQRYDRRVSCFAERMLGDREAAQDAAVETFLRVWRARSRYQPRGLLAAYLLRVARNVCLDYAAAERPEAALEEADRAAQPGDAALEATSRRLTAGAVRAAVLRLPEEQRAVFVLSQYEGLSYRDIAHTLGCALGTVASRKRLAVATLRRSLKEWMPDA